MNTFPLKQRLSGPQLPTHRHRRWGWETLYLSSVRPRLSISLVTSAISSFSLWEQTDRQTEEEEEETTTDIRYLWDVWVTLVEMLQSQWQHNTSHTVFSSNYISLTNTFRQTLTEEMTQKESPKSADVIHSLSQTDSFFLSAGVMWNSRPL